MAVATKTADGRPLVAWAIASARDYAGLTQPAMAEELARVTGERWTAPMVWKLERGTKRATWDIVQAVSAITGLPVRWFDAVDPQNWNPVDLAAAA